MAYVDVKSNSWKNADGLIVYFGTDEGKATTVGEYRTLGRRRQYEVDIDLTTLPTQASGNVQVLDTSWHLPAGCFIESLEIFTTKETAGTNANLNIGLVKTDLTVYDDDGILAAGDDFNGGTDLGTTYTYVKGTTDAGALVGTKLAYNGYLCAQPDTADFTAGVIKVRIYVSFPLSTEV